MCVHTHTQSVCGIVDLCSQYGKPCELCSKKLKTELPYDWETPLLGIYQKKTNTLIWKDIFSLMLIAALFTTAKTWKQPKCLSTEEWIKKNVVGVYIHNGILLSHKKNEILLLTTTWIDLNEVSQTEKDKYSTLSPTRGIQKMKQMNVYNKTEMDS